MQAEKQAADPDFKPLNIACVFSPPAEGDPDVKQIQEDLPQEKADNEEDPEGKKAALKAILADYNARYGTNHRISEFDRNRPALPSAQSQFSALSSSSILYRRIANGIAR
jgi:type I restriction enzyme, R subunit